MSQNSKNQLKGLHCKYSGSKLKGCDDESWSVKKRAGHFCVWEIQATADTDRLLTKTDVTTNSFKCIVYNVVLYTTVGRGGEVRGGFVFNLCMGFSAPWSLNFFIEQWTEFWVLFWIWCWVFFHLFKFFCWGICTVL